MGKKIRPTYRLEGYETRVREPYSYRYQMSRREILRKHYEVFTQFSKKGSNILIYFKIKVKVLSNRYPVNVIISPYHQQIILKIMEVPL